MQQGVNLLLDEVRQLGREPKELFTTSFGPNCRHAISCSGTRVEQRAYVEGLFEEGVPALRWRDEDGHHCSKEAMFCSFWLCLALGA